MTTITAQDATVTPLRLRRALCAVDGSPEAAVAAAQAARLLGEESNLLLVAVADPWEAVLGARGDLEAARERELAACGRSLLDARLMLDDPAEAESRVREGQPRAVLLDEAQRGNADLLALGYHGGGRVKGLLAGGPVTLLLREAPCSVLVARASTLAPDWPRRIVVGVDGSPHSRLAAAHARTLGRALAADVCAVTAGAPRRRALPPARAVEGLPHEIDARGAARALVARSQACDLIVVGSRGLGGLRALGSVSERVAHRAACSVLVVR